MRYRTLGIVAGIAVTGLAGCARHAPAQASATAAAEPTPYKVTATVKQVMQAITVPASTVLFNVASTAPTNDEEWTAVDHAAIALAESGNLLLMDGRAVDHGNWMKLSRAMIDATSAAIAAVAAKDAEKVATASDAVYQTCEDCHMQYMKKN